MAVLFIYENKGGGNEKSCPSPSCPSASESRKNKFYRESCPPLPSYPSAVLWQSKIQYPFQNEISNGDYGQVAKAKV